MKKIAILQSNYIPWKGYFDLINSVDTFIIYDDMQYTKRDWRNRNKIQSPNGLKWLTIPVKTKSKFHQSIFETEVDNIEWTKKHWETIQRAYAKAPFFEKYKKTFEELYLNTKEQYLSEINYKFLKEICNLLNINTKILLSSEFNLKEGKSEKLLDICKTLNATHYISGPAAKNYLDIDLFDKESISVEWADYTNYKEYKQLYAPFNHNVSILDLLFNTGEDIKKYMKSFKDFNV